MAPLENNGLCTIGQFPNICIGAKGIVRKNTHEDKTLIGILDIYFTQKAFFENSVHGGLKLNIPGFGVWIYIQLL